MMKKLLAFAVVAALSACSSSNKDDDSPSGTTTSGSGTTAGTTTGGDTTSGGSTTGGTNVGGGTAGVWFGATAFGSDGVVIIDGDNVYGLSSNGSGRYESMFGANGGALVRFIHRDSENAASADSFTLVGDLPSSISSGADTASYSFDVTNDGQQLDATGDAGNFSLTFAGTGDVAAISLADVAGDWQAKTSFCSVNCNIVLDMSIAADGTVSGGTTFNDLGQTELSGTASTPASSSQYLNVSFTWNTYQRTGVLYHDRNSDKLVLNSYGLDEEDVTKSFSAIMIKQ